MKTIAALIFLTLSVSALAETEGSMLKKAMAGDYQAQRNLAFGYATGDQRVQVNSMKGCAWRYVILKSGSPRVDESDVSNFKVYCGKLDPVSAEAADAMAVRLLHEIYPDRY